MSRSASRPEWSTLSGEKAVDGRFMSKNWPASCGTVHAPLMGSYVPWACGGPTIALPPRITFPLSYTVCGSPWKSWWYGLLACRV